MSYLAVVLGLIPDPCLKVIPLHLDTRSYFRVASDLVGVPEDLLLSICWVESKHTLKAHNPRDGKSASYGVCQVKMNTAKFMASEGKYSHLVIDSHTLSDPQTNVVFAALYLRWQLKRYKWDERKAISAYNAGRAIKGNKRYVSEVLKANKKGFEVCHL